MSKFKACLSVLSAGLILSSGVAMAKGYGAEYQVTVTNLTRNISFTPILVASHRAHLSAFELGSTPSDELAALAEGGDIAPLSDSLHASGKLVDLSNSEGLLSPGESVTVTVSARYGASHITLASMMLPTNDSFIGLNSVRAPWYGKVTYYSPGYDAGSEPNDELCVNIPGPVCGGAGGSPGVGGEGFVHVNNGIQGVGDLSSAVYDWRNPVAKITIAKIR